MLLDKPNAELLRLIALCKDVPRSNQFSCTNLLSDANIERLHDDELIYTSKDGRYYRVTKIGYDLLQQCGHVYLPDEHRVCVQHVLTRRAVCSQVMITILLAGVDVFTENPQELTDSSKYICAANVRRVQQAQGRNVLANTRFAGIMGNGYLFFPVIDAQFPLYYKYEVKRANSVLPRRNTTAVFYMGTDYPSLCAAVTGPAGTKATYRTAYDKFTQPVHLCPCNTDGAIQLRVMLQPEYRRKLFNLVTPSKGASLPDTAFPGCDGMFKGEPVAIGVDMNLRRISALAGAAQKAGKKLHIFSRLCQTEALITIIGKEGVGYYNITDEELINTFGFSSLITDPPLEVYITKEGGVISDQTLRDCKETRKARRSKAQADSKQRKDG